MENKNAKQQKVNLFLSLMAILLSALLGFWVFSLAKGNENDIVAGIISTLCFLTSLIPLMGINYSTTRLGVNIRILSFIVFILFLAVNFIYAIYGVSIPSYILVNGILIVIYLTIFTI